MTTAELSAAAASAVAARPSSAGFWSDAAYRVRHDPTTLVALGVLGLIALVAVLGDVLADNVFHRSLSQQSLLDNYSAPSLDESALWLGTDDLGRSQIVRLIYGGRVSLAIGTFGALTSMLIGLSLGISSGYFRGWWDDLVQWLVQTIVNIPRLYLLLIIAALWRLNPITLTVLLGTLGWVGICLQARGLTFALREREFTFAARSIGASPHAVHHEGPVAHLRAWGDDLRDRALPVPRRRRAARRARPAASRAEIARRDSSTRPSPAAAPGAAPRSRSRAPHRRPSGSRRSG